MKGEKLILTIVAIVTIALVGVLVFIGADKNMSTTSSLKSGLVNQEEDTSQTATNVKEAEQPTKSPKQVANNTNRALSEFSLVVKDIQKDSIVLTGGPKEILVPMNEELVQVLVSTGGETKPGKLTDVTVGMSAELKILDDSHMVLTVAK